MDKNTNSVNKALINYRTKNKQLNITISNDIYEMFVNYCNDMSISKKEAIEKMIKEYIKYNAE